MAIRALFFSRFSSAFLNPVHTRAFSSDNKDPFCIPIAKSSWSIPMEENKEWNEFAVAMMDSSTRIFKKRHAKTLEQFDKEVKLQKTLDKIQKDIEEIKMALLDIQKKSDSQE